MILFFVWISIGSVAAQDKSRSNKKQIRETRLKIRTKQGDRAHLKDQTGRKVRTKRKQTAPKPVHSAPNPYAGRKRKTESERYQPNAGFFNQPSRPSEKTHKGDISGSRLKYNPSDSKNRQPSHYAQPNPYAGRRRQTESRRAQSNAPQLGSIRSASRSSETRNKKRSKITPRSASSPYVARTKSTANIYYGRKKGGETAHTKNIRGRKFTSPRSISPNVAVQPSFSPYAGRKRKGDVAYSGKKTARNISISKRGEQKYSGKAAGSSRTATRRGEQAWRNDISGHKLRMPADPGAVQGNKGQPLFNSYANKMKGKGRSLGGRVSGGGYMSATPRGEFKSASKNPNLSRKLSQSGKVKQGKGQAITGTSVQNPKISGFSGGIKSSGKIKGAGGSVSKSGWNNKGNALPRNDNFQSGLTLSQGNLKLGTRYLHSPYGNKKANRVKAPSGSSFSINTQGNIKGSKRPLKGGGSISKSGWNNRGNALTRKPPGAGTEKATHFKGRFTIFELSPGYLAEGATKFQGNQKLGTRYLRSPYSNKKANPVKAPSKNAFGINTQGNIKGYRKPVKGGGSISKSGWNNRGNALPRKSDFESTKLTLSQGNYKVTDLLSKYGFDRVGTFQGNVKGARKPLKGGGSISKSGWNNKGNALPRKSDFESTKLTLSQGSIKGYRKPVKGGGSISKSGWNNKGNALPRKSDFQSTRLSLFQGNLKVTDILPQYGFDNIGSYQGNMKGARKPLKGGGSISKSGWNNKGNALPRKSDFESTKLSLFKGNLKVTDILPQYGFDDIGLYQGNMKGARKPAKGGGSISKSGWNNNGQALARKSDFESTKQTLFQGNIKGYRKPLKGGGSISQSGWNNDGEPIQKKALTFQNFYTGKFQGRFKSEADYKHNPNAHEDARDVKKPHSSTFKAMAYQGNFKVKKTYERGMHPSAKYTTHQKPLSSTAEKEKVLKFRIWWAKLVKKNENQPAVVKEKVRKPRYDKREQDLWYD